MRDDFDPLSARFAVVIAVVVAALLVSIAVRADGVAGPVPSPPFAEPGPHLDPTVYPDELAGRALGWVTRRPDAAFRFGAGRRRDGDEAWVREELVPAAIDAAQGARFPEAWPDAELLLAKAWWESRWRATQVGRFVVVAGRVVRGHGGEVGVMQIKPRICRRYVRAGEDCADTRVNLRIAATILREHLAACGAGRHRQALRFYATGQGCAPPRFAEKTVTVWAEQIRRGPR